MRCLLRGHRWSFLGLFDGRRLEVCRRCGKVRWRSIGWVSSERAAIEEDT